MRTPDPYRLFFPLGILLGLGGVAIWPLYYFGILTGYWGIAHAFLQSNGFLFCFVAGFLLTAVPRITGTEVPSLPRQWLLASFLISGAVLLELQRYAFAQTLFCLAYLLLAVLLGSSMVRRQKLALPETFPMIPIALLSGLIGALLTTLATWGVPLDGWALAGKRSLTEGMTLLLVMGVGGFLGPRLLGFDRLQVVQIAGVETRKDRPHRKALLLGACGVLVPVSVLLQYGLGLERLSFLRAAAATCVLLLTLEPWRKPAHRTTLSWCVWTSIWITILSVWLVALVPKHQVDFLHALFIGGFSLLILAVGLRVTLSHGGHALTSETKNWPLRIGLITGLLALIARTGAPFSKDYAIHLELAAILWLIGLGIYGYRLVGLIVRAKA